MSHTLLRGCALLLLGIGVFAASAADAKVRCTNPVMTELAFGNVNPQSTETDFTATFSATCNNNTGLTTKAATICLSIEQPRKMTNGSATLDFQLYHSSARILSWGSQFSGLALPHIINIIIPLNGTRQIEATLYGRVLGGQTTVIPGAYTRFFTAGETRMTVNAPLDDTPPFTCNTNPTGDLRFPFTVSANVINKCTFTVSPLDFGTNPGLLNTAVNANATLAVQCSNTTPYNVSLDAGQNGGGDINARKMMLGGNSVSYQLYRDSGRTQVWGDTIGSNTATGIGNGTTSQSMTVYGSVPPQTTPPAGTYNDIVVVTVTY